MDVGRIFLALQQCKLWGCMCMRGCVFPHPQLPGQHGAEEASRILARLVCVDDGSSLKGTLATQDKTFAPGSGVKSTNCLHCPVLMMSNPGMDPVPC